MALHPPLALRLPIKKIAAVLALGGASFYLALSGAAIATQRAYLMMAILFLAVLLDRPAITLRNVALAAIIVLALFPESLFDVSSRCRSPPPQRWWRSTSAGAGVGRLSLRDH
jgi:competence protein ComEC